MSKAIVNLKDSNLNQLIGEEGATLVKDLYDYQDRYQELHDYKVVCVQAKNVQKGDIIAIDVACYDDIPNIVKPVETIEPYIFEAKVAGLVINGFVYKHDDQVFILRQCGDENYGK